MLSYNYLLITYIICFSLFIPLFKVNSVSVVFIVYPFVIKYEINIPCLSTVSSSLVLSVGLYIANIHRSIGQHDVDCLKSDSFVFVRRRVIVAKIPIGMRSIVTMRL
jgi:hypothetical protein